MKAKRLLLIIQLKHAQELQTLANTTFKKLDSLSKALAYVRAGGYANIDPAGTALTCTNLMINGDIERDNYIDLKVEHNVTTAIYDEFIASIIKFVKDDQDKKTISDFLKSNHNTSMEYLMAFEGKSQLPNPIEELKLSLNSAEKKLSLAMQELKTHYVTMQSAEITARSEIKSRLEKQKEQIKKLSTAIPDKSNASIQAQNCRRLITEFLAKIVKENDFSNLKQKWDAAYASEEKTRKPLTTVNNVFSDTFVAQFDDAITPIPNLKYLLQALNDQKIKLKANINQLRLLREDAKNRLEIERKEQAEENFLAKLVHLGFQIQESKELEVFEKFEELDELDKFEYLDKPQGSADRIDEEEFKRIFIKNYLLEYNHSFFKNPFSEIREKINNNTLTYQDIMTQASSNPSSRTSKIVKTMILQGNEAAQINEFKKAYLDAYHNSFFKNPFSKGLRGLFEVTSMKHIVDYAGSNPTSRTATVLRATNQQ